MTTKWRPFLAKECSPPGPWPRGGSAVLSGPAPRQHLLLLHLGDHRRRGRRARRLTRHGVGGLKESWFHGEWVVARRRRRHLAAAIAHAGRADTGRLALVRAVVEGRGNTAAAASEQKLGVRAGLATRGMFLLGEQI